MINLLKLFSLIDFDEEIENKGLKVNLLKTIKKL